MPVNRRRAYEIAAERDDWQCQLCGRPASDVHHILFRSHGGSDDPRNLICLCRKCHNDAHGDERVFRDRLFEINKKKHGNFTVEDVKK